MGFYIFKTNQMFDRIAARKAPICMHITRKFVSFDKTKTMQQVMELLAPKATENTH